MPRGDVERLEPLPLRGLPAAHARAPAADPAAGLRGVPAVHVVGLVPRVARAPYPLVEEPENTC